MRLLWTKNERIGSKMIRWTLEEPVSHFAVQFGNFVFDADLAMGFHPYWYQEWRKRREPVYTLCPKSVNESHLMQHIATQFSGDDYDKLAYFFFGIRALMRKFAKIPLPIDTPLDIEEDLICTGVARAIQDIYPQWFSEHVENFDIVTPFSLYENMRTSGQFLEESPCK